MEIKQVILVRMDLKMDKGKMGAQIAHASVDCVLKSDDEMIQEWKDEGMKKVVLKVKDQKELMEYKDKAKKAKLVYAVIKDAGKTFFKRPTITCMGIGPDKEDKIDAVTGKLGML